MRGARDRNPYSHLPRLEWVGLGFPKGERCLIGDGTIPPEGHHFLDIHFGLAGASQERGIYRIVFVVILVS